MLLMVAVCDMGRGRQYVLDLGTASAGFARIGGEKGSDSKVGYQAITCSQVAIDLKPDPIDPSWILEGEPMARSTVLSSSRDLQARVLVLGMLARQVHVALSHG